MTAPHTPFYIRRVDETLPDFIVRIKAEPSRLPLLEETPPRTLAPTHTCGASDWYIHPNGTRECRPCRAATSRRLRARRALP